MADIDIVPKRRSSTWMWVLLVVVVLAVIFWLFARQPRPVAQMEQQGGVQSAVQSAVDRTSGALRIA